MAAIVSDGNTLTVVGAPTVEGSVFRRWFSTVSHWQITSFVLTVAGFAFCATATGVAWRVWYVENDASIGSGTLVIGIWEVCFIQRKKLMGQNYGFPQCWPFTEEHTSLPKAMLIAQDLMIFVNLLDISTLGLMFFALWNVLKSKNAHAFLLTFFSVASTLNIISAILLLVPVVWNTHSILLAEEIRFPEEFNLPNSPNDQDIGTAIYLAYCAIFLKFLSGLLILWENSLLRLKKDNPSKKVSEHSAASLKTDSQTICPQCGSSIDLKDLVAASEWYSDIHLADLLRSSSKDNHPTEPQSTEIPVEIPIPPEDTVQQV